jgi:hypothetical protein
MKATPPYDFIVDYLPAAIIVRRVFGMYYIYLNQKNMLILRKLSKNQNLHGIWIATGKDFHASLKAAVPSIADFEMAAIKICGLISHGDPRIGKLTEKSISL